MFDALLALDANNDGRIQRNEWLSIKAKLTEAADAEGPAEEKTALNQNTASADEKAEFSAAEEKAIVARAISAADVDGDGMLDRDEFLKAAAKEGLSVEQANKAFNRIDANHDGRIEEKEVLALGKKEASSEAGEDGGFFSFVAGAVRMNERVRGRGGW